jgi:hypothetical protein
MTGNDKPAPIENAVQRDNLFKDEIFNKPIPGLQKICAYIYQAITCLHSFYLTAACGIII